MGIESVKTPREFDLAETIHEVTCKVNHQFQCAWYDEEAQDHPWHALVHARFLSRAQRMMRLTSLDPRIIDRVLKAL